MMYYATDLGNTMLTQKNMVGIPLKVENKVNGVVKKITVVDYDFFNSTQVLPKYIKEYNRDNTTFTTRLDVLSYNGSGLPLSAIINNALVPETYAWSATMLLLSKTFGGLTWSYTYKLNSRLTESVIRLCWVCLRFQQILNQKTGMLVRVSVTPYRVLKRSAI